MQAKPSLTSAWPIIILLMLNPLSTNDGRGEAKDDLCDSIITTVYQGQVKGLVFTPANFKSVLIRELDFSSPEVREEHTLYLKASGFLCLAASFAS